MPSHHSRRIFDYFIDFFFVVLLFLIEWKQVFIRPELWFCLFLNSFWRHKMAQFYYIFSPHFVNAMIAENSYTSAKYVIHSNALMTITYFWQFNTEKCKLRYTDWICLPSGNKISSHGISYGKIQCCQKEGRRRSLQYFNYNFVSHKRLSN